MCRAGRFVASASAALALGCGAAQGAAVGSAPDFSLRTVDGETFRLRDHVGSNVVLISFWTSFCPSCKTELTQLQSLFAELEGDGLLVVAVALDQAETVGNVRTVRDRLGFTFPVVIDAESVVAGLYNPRGATPFTVIIDGQGRRAYSHEGFVAGDLARIESTVRELLGGLRPAADGPGDGPGGGGAR